MHHFRYHFLGKAFPNGCVDISIAAKRTPYGFFAAELCRNVLNFRCHLVVYVSLTFAAKVRLAPTVAPFKLRHLRSGCWTQGLTARHSMPGP